MGHDLVKTQGRTTTVIIVTRLNGPQFSVNPDLLQRIDSAPDTILTFVDGTKYIVKESMHDVIDLITDYRALLVARAQDVQQQHAQQQAHQQAQQHHPGLRAVTDHDDAGMPAPTPLHPRRK